MNFHRIAKLFSKLPMDWNKGWAGLSLVTGAALFFFSSCEEIGPIIDLTGTFNADTTYVTTQVDTPQIKNVLLEEFTGVRCVNCPKGHVLIDNLKNQYGSRFIAVSAHSEFQAEPYDGDQDLRTPQADSLEKLLGPIIVKPSGAVDRKKFPGDSLLVFTSKWTTYVAQQMTLTTPVNIYLEVNYNNGSRMLDATVTLHYTSEDTLESRFTVMLLEDEIITAQLGNSGIDSNYVQKRVLRKMLPSVTGIPLTITRERGRVIVKSFNFILPTHWNAENLRVVAFVHRTQGNTEALQVVEAEVQ